MNVLLGIGVLMMVPMMTGPPERTFLCTGQTQKPENKLEGAAGLVGSMRKIAVIDAGDGKHPNKIESDTNPERSPAKSGPEDEETADMNQPENALFYEVHRGKIGGDVARVHGKDSSKFAKK